MERRNERQLECTCFSIPLTLLILVAPVVTVIVTFWEFADAGRQLNVPRARISRICRCLSCPMETLATFKTERKRVVIQEISRYRCNTRKWLVQISRDYSVFYCTHCKAKKHYRETSEIWNTMGQFHQSIKINPPN